MKNFILSIIALQCLSTMVLADNKYGALAVDRSNGFFYGWSYDHSSQSRANDRAFYECKNRGGKCGVVLELSGNNKCGAYRTIDGEIGTAYGWGKASTKQAADNIAGRECRKRSAGQYCGNHVWACNSTSVADSKESQVLDINAIKRAVTAYYDNKGVWAGKFKIGSIEKIRLDSTGSKIAAHVRYEYLPVPGNSRKPGYDQRIFYIQKNRGRHTVNRMGDYMSASF